MKYAGTAMKLKKHDDYKYKFSFVMPVYNAEQYLTDTVESILAQTLDFEKNCEIIFVNDGSTDKSEDVCLRFKQQFPDNIQYIKQINAGPVAARNRGIALASGKYISLLDSDDLISEGTLHEVYNFFDSHYDQIDFVSIKQKFFEAREGDHPLNYKFTQSRVIDLTKEFDNIQMSAPSSFIKSAVLKKNKLDETVGRYAEDSKLMAEIALNKKQYGVVSEAIYYYRKRTDKGSSQDSTASDKFWYLDTPRRVWKALIEEAKKAHGEVPKFIQFMIMYDLQWRYKQADQNVLSASELDTYKDLLTSLLSDIDDEVIMKQRQISLEYKLFILGKKHGVSILDKAERKNNEYFYRDQKVFSPGWRNPPVRIVDIDITNKEILLRGFYNNFLFHDLDFKFRRGNESFKPQFIHENDKLLRFLDEVVFDRNAFQVKLTFNLNTPIDVLVISTPDHIEKKTAISLNESHSAINTDEPFKTLKKYIVYISQGSLVIRKNNIYNRVRKRLLKLD